MSVNYPTFQSDPILNSISASSGVSGSLGAFSSITASNISGTNDLFIGGNVGIGTSSPSLQGGGSGLEINGSAYTQLKLRSLINGTAGLQLSSSFRQHEIQSTDQGQFLVYDRTSGQYRVVIDSTGKVAIGNTTTPATELDVRGTGSFFSIKFPSIQSSSADPNTLDDYEEGTWTPALSGTNGVTFTGTGGFASKYTKIGNRVFLEGDVSSTGTGSATGGVRIGNLPFTVASSTRSGIYAYTFSGLSSSAGSSITGEAGVTTNHFGLYYGLAGTVSFLTVAQASGSSVNIKFNGNYSTT